MFYKNISENMSQADRTDLWGCLIDVVEEWLDSKGVRPDDIPNKDRDRDGSDAIIYGDDYDYLADGFADAIGIHRDNLAEFKG